MFAWELHLPKVLLALFLRRCFVSINLVLCAAARCDWRIWRRIDGNIHDELVLDMKPQRSRCRLSTVVPYVLVLLAGLIGWVSIDAILELVALDWTSQLPSATNRIDLFDGGYLSPLEEIVPFGKSKAIRNSSCTFWRCFNPYRCNYYGDYRLTVYIYPWRRYIRIENGTNVPLAPTPSREFIDLLTAIRRSPYFEPNPEKACVFVPAIDTLNEDRMNADYVGAAVAALSWWNNGENHLFFNMLPGSLPGYSTSLTAATGRAIVAGGGYSFIRSYRRTFDISIPVYNPMTSANVPHSRKRTWLLISTKPHLSNVDIGALRNLRARHPKPFLLLISCREPFESASRCKDRYRSEAHRNETEGRFEYPDVLQTANYCLILSGNRLGQPELSDALQLGCVPVVIIDEYVLPFSEVLDWKRAAVMIYRHQLPDVVEILKRDISEKRYNSMKARGAWFWRAYFSSMNNIAMTTLRILQDRVFPNQQRSYEEWNDDKQTLFPPMFLGDRIAPNDGFTAVILTYDRPTTLFRQLNQLSSVPSLAKVIVVWNNQRKPPPPADEWPTLNKPLKVIQTSENRLTNRFVPYNEIETEAVLSLDDDILMLNSDELEFGYQAWREFPSYLVGYPSRVHVFDSEKQRWTYESEWTNNASLILTGAAFYHNYYNLLFTETLPKRLKNWIDRMMNCEDIAMNFMIANYTGRPALKVTPRKKFKPNDKTGQDLSADSAHLMQRSECLNRLSRYFGGMVLKTVEFRLDPLLYKVDVIPEDVKSYADVGPL